MLSAIGLAFDLIGAVALVIGLFRPPRPLYLGWSYDPHEAAQNVPYGVTGGTFLVLGFALQSLTYFGWSPDYSDGAVRAAALAALAGGAVAAVVLYGVTYLVALPRQIRYTADKHDLHYYVRREPKGFRFWRHLAVQPPPDKSVE